MREKKIGRLKLLLMQILKYFTEISNTFLTASVYFQNNFFKLIQNILLVKVEQNYELFCQKKTFNVSECAPSNKLKLFFGKMFHYFATSMENLLFTNSIFEKNIALMWSQKGKFYIKALKSLYAFFILQNFFSVLNGVPSGTLKVFFGKIYFFSFNFH